MVADVDQSTGKRKPSRASRTANRLEDQASKHEKRDKHRKSNKQFRDVGSRDMCNTLCQHFHCMRAIAPRVRNWGFEDR